MKAKTLKKVNEYLTVAVTTAEMAESIRNILSRLGNPNDDDAAVLRYFAETLD